MSRDGYLEVYIATANVIIYYIYGFYYMYGNGQKLTKSMLIFRGVPLWREVLYDRGELQIYGRV